MAEGGSVDGVREKQKCVETKVYTRKVFKGLRKNNNDNNNTNSIADVDTVKNKEDNDDIRIKETSTALTITTPTPTTNTNNNNNDHSDANGDINDDSANSLPQPHPCTTATEDEKPTQQQLILRIDAVSDGSSCPNHLQGATGEDVQSSWDQPSGNGAVEHRDNNSTASRFKHVDQELRCELEMLRNVLKRVAAKQGELSEASKFHGSANEGMYKVGEDNQIPPEISDVCVPRERSRHLNQLSISALKSSRGVIDYAEKEKRTPKENSLYRSSEFLLGKDKLPPAVRNKKAEVNIKKPSVGKIPPGFWLSSKCFKSCNSLLDRLIKHEYGWVFAAPVDVKGLGLYDYHTIIQHPMDLGTVKSRLNKNWYKTPYEFAEAVRLTFHNAMTYNPPGHEVRAMADQLSTILENTWAVIESDYNREMRFRPNYGAASSTSLKGGLPPPRDRIQIFEMSESTTNKPLRPTPSARAPALKKPLAKDPYKRNMTLEEKEKLNSNLQNLLSVKSNAIIQIIKKRNPGIFPDGKPIDIEIDSMDVETLWELDRFVINYRKGLNQMNRKAALALQARGDDKHNIVHKVPVLMEVPKETKADENIVSTSVLVRGQGNSSRSRTSSSSSSSSDSGSSSSGSDSETDSSSTSGSDSGS